MDPSCHHLDVIDYAVVRKTIEKTRPLRKERVKPKAAVKIAKAHSASM